MGYKHIYAKRNILQTFVIQAVYAILHKHRHSIKRYSVDGY